MFIYLDMIENNEDKTKFEIIYDKYGQIMFFTANNILGNSDLAEIAVYHSFLKTIRHLDKIDENEYEKTKTFVVIATIQESIDVYKKSKRNKVVPFNDFNAAAKKIFTAINVRLGEDEISTLPNAIVSLPFNYSSILLLKWSQGYSDQEISEIMSLPEEIVQQRIEHAKKRLVDIIERSGEKEETTYEAN